MTFSQKSFKSKPPDKGSFPLDHEGECKLEMLGFMQCLRKNDNDNSLCRFQSMKYLGCRMDKGLMKRESWEMLGFADLINQSGPTTDLDNQISMDADNQKLGVSDNKDPTTTNNH